MSGFRGEIREVAVVWVLALTSVASLMVSLDVLVVTTALTSIRRDLGASIEQLQWTVNAYTLASAVLLMTGAVLGDRFGRRRVFVIGLALFTAASAACALAPGVGALIAARTVQGAGGALVMPAAVALLGAAFPPARRGRALGIFQGVTGLAVLSGPFVGGAVTEGIAWEWIFWLNVPIGVVLIPLVLSRVADSRGPRARVDVAGVLLITGAGVGLAWGLVRGNSAGWASPEIIGTLAAGALLALWFVRWELRAGEPMLPMRFFRSAVFSGANLATFCLFAALFGAAFLIAAYLQIGLGHGPLAAGLLMIPWTATLFLVAPVAGAFVDRLGPRPFIAAGLFLQAAGMAWLALLAGGGYLELVPPLIIAGAGVSMAMPAAQAAVVGAVPPAGIGKAAGVHAMMRGLGGVFGIAIVGAVFAAAGSLASAASAVAGFPSAIAACAALSLIGAAAGLVVGSPGDRSPDPARHGAIEVGTG